MYGSEAEDEPIRGIDETNHEGQLHDLLFGEMWFERSVVLIRGMCRGDERQGLGPAQGRALALGVQRGLTPAVQEVDALLGLSMGAGTAGVEVDAEGAAIELGCADLDELAEARLSPRASTFLLKSSMRLRASGATAKAFILGFMCRSSFWRAKCPSVPRTTQPMPRVTWPF